MNAQHIILLRIKDYGRIEAAEIQADGRNVVLGGQNGAGKSSVLNAILAAFGGKGAILEDPIRDGAKSASILVETEDFTVNRQIGAGGTELVVRGKDGKKVGSAQSFLDGITGKLSFDPTAFMRDKPPAQLETLRTLVGLDFSEIDTDRKRIYDERHAKGIELKTAMGAWETAGDPDDGFVDGAAETPMSSVMGELNGIDSHNTRVDALGNEVISTRQALEAATVAVADLEARLVTARKAHAEATKAHEGKKTLAATAAYQKQDREPTVKKMNALEESNALIRANQNCMNLRNRVAKLEAEYKEYDRAIEVLDQQKRDEIAAAKFPVEGLSLDEGGVVFNGKQFSQASTAEATRVSVAMGIALNPALRVMILRNGNDLDARSMKMVKEMGDASGVQIWIEKVSEDGKGCTVVIEDGHATKNPT